jgi:hypothetical protein
VEENNEISRKIGTQMKKEQENERELESRGEIIADLKRKEMSEKKKHW